MHSLRQYLSTRDGDRAWCPGPDRHHVKVPLPLVDVKQPLLCRLWAPRRHGSGTAALREAQDEVGPVLVHIETDPMVPAPDSEAWWDVPVAEVSALDVTRQAREAYAMVALSFMITGTFPLHEAVA